ncbi:MAG: polar amino acid transport system substrate-binding protein [Solirubrobacterales bacterium]|jgi:ABC-type amino acid transport substrate-binding protein|nr:polar amino acid transport system substrate-binding protein [Solirubrobacterales bacterium]
MRKTRLTALFAVFLVAIASVVVAGCGGSDSSTEAAGGGEPLTVGSDIPYPPFEQGKPGSYTGFDIDLMEAISEKIGRTPEFQDTSFETIFRDVAQGKFEAVISAATITPEREKAVAFSDPYYLSEQAILVKEGSDIKGLTDLEGKIVGAQQGTTGLELGKEKANASELRPYPEGPDAVNALKAGTVEAVIIDAPVAQNAVEKAGGIEIAEKVPTEESYGIALAKDNTGLLEEINQGLKEVEEDGTYTTIYEKWFHLEPPKQFVG